MPLLAETIVEEWLNQHGYFTIRGIKQGAGEMDLLAVHPSAHGVKGCHVEVQVSFHPIGYISKHNGSYVRARTGKQVEAAAREWVTKKFSSAKKVQLRERLWPGIRWEYHLVHGVVRYPQELEVFSREGVKCHPLHELLTDLSRAPHSSFFSASGADLADIATYYKAHGKTRLTKRSRRARPAGVLW